jgi:hypothetical protein
MLRMVTGDEVLCKGKPFYSLLRLGVVKTWKSYRAIKPYSHYISGRTLLLWGLERLGQPIAVGCNKLLKLLKID